LNRSTYWEKKTMRYRPPDPFTTDPNPNLFTTNLLAFLEAISLGVIDGTEEEARRASQAATMVTQNEARRWRVYRRPSRQPNPGRSKIMRRAGLSLTLLLSISLSLRAVTCDRAGCGTVRHSGEGGNGDGDSPGLTSLLGSLPLYLPLQNLTLSLSIGKLTPGARAGSALPFLPGAALFSRSVVYV
jgi:hypothetical protein